MTGPILQITDLKVEFPGLVRNVRALRGVDLVLHKGQIVGLVGESGSGKSLTALACLGLVPNSGRVSGSIMLDGFEVVGRGELELGRLRGGVAAMIFQNPMRALNPFFTVGQQMVEVIRCHRPFGRTEAVEAASEGLRDVQMPDPEIALGKYPHQMSGGQIQRVMIALGLACRPRLLIADECTTALDVTVQAQILVLLRELTVSHDLSVLFITHDLSVVATVCDRVAVMYAGEVVENGSVTDVFADPLHPYTRKLMSTVPTLGRAGGELESIRGQVPDLALPLTGCTFCDRCDDALDVCAATPPGMRRYRADHQAACHDTARRMDVE
ncbi:MAG TPA: ABC transporter ATP-binding protein [Pseudomonadales bacterium]|nr:ABC transporter ATP-binding protein [Pseudomonadales bacterium]